MKKLLAIVLTLVMLLSIVPLGTMTASAATSGTTGDCTWTLDGDVLTISGNGKMGDCSNGITPWGKGISKVIIEDGVTSVGMACFYMCKNLSDVQISNTVTTIGVMSFMNCTNLKSIKIPDAVKELKNLVFFGCSNLSEVYIGSGLENYSDAFYECYNL